MFDEQIGEMTGIPGRDSNMAKTARIQILSRIAAYDFVCIVRPPYLEKSCHFVHYPPPHSELRVKPSHLASLMQPHLHTFHFDGSTK